MLLHGASANSATYVLLLSLHSLTSTAYTSLSRRTTSKAEAFANAPKAGRVQWHCQLLDHAAAESLRWGSGRAKDHHELVRHPCRDSSGHLRASLRAGGGQYYTDAPCSGRITFSDNSGFQYLENSDKTGWCCSLT